MALHLQQRESKGSIAVCLESNSRMKSSNRMLSSIVLFIIAIKPILTVKSLPSSIKPMTKVKSEFDSPFSKPIFTSYGCEGVNDCPGDYDATAHQPIKNIQQMWKFNSKKTSGEYGIIQTNFFFLLEEDVFLSQWTHIILKVVECFGAD